MGKHLDTTWVYYPTPNGKNKLKRVSATREAALPRRYRELLASGQTAQAVKLRRTEAGCTLSEAWDWLKAATHTPAATS